MKIKELRKKLKKLKEERYSLVKKARKILDTADEEDRSLETDENSKYEKINEEIDDYSEKIQKYQRQLELEEEMNSLEGSEGKEGGKQKGNKTSEFRDMLDRFSTLTRKERNKIRETDGYRDVFNKFLERGTNALNEKEYRAMQADDDVGGGYLKAPKQMVSELLKDVDDRAYIRQLATVYQLETAASLGVPSLDDDLDDADWTSELKTGSTDDMDFGERELNPHALAKRVKVSNKLLRVATQDPEALVRARLAYKFGITEEKGFLTGNGAQQPLGIFTASDDGISTSRDVSEDMETTSITADGLINAKYSLKSAYQSNARWMFHRDGVKQIRKLKDGNGQYLWSPGISAAEGDMILDLPFVMSEYVPNAFTSGNYVGAVGDFSYYWIAEALDMRIQRLVELYAETNQTGYIGRMEVDGMPVLEEAFTRVTLA
jgi:HK97 family phage major capsid protein